MKRSFKSAASALALALALAVASPAKAVSTVDTTLSTTVYGDLGAGPIVLGASGGNVFYQIADAQPPAGTPAFVVRPGDPPVVVPTTSHIWALGSTASTIAIVAPYTAAGGGGGGGGSVTQGTVPWVDDITQWANDALGAPSNYGTSPGAVVVPGVNAFVTNVPAVSQSGTWNFGGLGTAGSPSGGVVSVQGVTSGQALPVSGTFWQTTQPVSLTTLPGFTSTPTINSAQSGAWNVGITGPLGAAQSSPASPVAVVEPDDFAVSGSVTSAAVLFTQDMLGYSSITVEVTANASGNTITFETSDDNTNWATVSGLVTSTLGTSSAVTSTTTTTVAMLRFAKAGRYFRARVSTFVSGTTTVVGDLHKYVVPNVLSTVSLQTSTFAIGKTAPGYTSVQTPASNSSGVVANANAVATLTGVSAKSTYLSGFDITSDGATAGGCVNPTVTGLLGGTRTYTYCVPTGATVMATPLVISFVPPLISSTTNTNIVVTVPALGAGSTTATVNAQGYVE